MNPSISVIIPLYNVAKFLPLAVQSIFAQDVTPSEVLIIDDGSTDNSLQVAQQLAINHPQIRVLSQENGGPAKARNTGIQEAKGDIVFFVDADDEIPPNTFSLQLEQLRVAQEQHGPLTAVRGKLQLLIPSETGWQLYGEPQDMAVITSGIYPKAFIEKVGLFDESLRVCEDTDWLLRAEELGVVIVNHDYIVLHYRRHQSNITLDINLVKTERLRMYKKRLDRKRARDKEELTP